MTCAELVELVTEYFEGALPERDRERFEEHIASCAPCRMYLAQMRETIARTGELREESVSSAARDQLLAAFRSWHNEN